jgi:hypothetical protein
MLPRGCSRYSICEGRIKNYKFLLSLKADAATEKADATKLDWKAEQIAVLDGILLFVSDAET